MMNGLMIDCCRILEKPAYYLRLVDFMADWGMTHLQLHFTDNHGCAIELPGFSHLAMPHAFTPGQVVSLCRHAEARGIEVIPELETFGHTQYLTDHPRHRHLFAGRQDEAGGQKRGGLNPLDPESASLMKELIDQVIAIFPSSVIHLGCDEVKLDLFLKAKGVDPEAAWASYVGTLLEHVLQRGKTPAIWGDYLKAHPQAAARLRKDVIVMEWDYEADASDAAIKRLQAAGFRSVIAAPSIIFCRYRVFPTTIAFKNTSRMVRQAARHSLNGVMNTAWCPHRYITNALYYAIAYSAYLVAHGGAVSVREFRRVFARRVFGCECDRALDRFLSLWPRLNITGDLAKKLAGEEAPLTGGDLQHLKEINTLGAQALELARRFSPAANHDIWNAMVLSAHVAWACSESAFATEPGRRRDALQASLDRLIAAVDQEWDRTRHPDDPHKHAPHFREPRSSYLLPLLSCIRERCA
jgi:hypothetical protein